MNCAVARESLGAYADELSGLLERLLGSVLPSVLADVEVELARIRGRS